MPTERSLAIKGHVEIRQLTAMISAAIDGASVELIRKGDGLGVARFFEFRFRDKDLRMDRKIRGHHGYDFDGERFRGEDYTYLVTGAFGVTNRVLKRIGETLGGNYLDEDNKEEILFPFPDAVEGMKP